MFGSIYTEQEPDTPVTLFGVGSLEYLITKMFLRSLSRSLPKNFGSVSMVTEGRWSRLFNEPQCVKCRSNLQRRSPP